MRLFKQTPEDYYNAPYAEFPALIRGTVVVVMAILWTFSKLMWRWKVEDADLLFERQEGRGSVVICNHTSMAELLAVETALFFGGRRIRPIFKSEFAKSKIVRWAFSRVGGIPVERGTADMKCLRAAQHALQRGEDVLIFPEGTRSKDGEIGRFKAGAFTLAKESGVDILPVVMTGTKTLIKKNLAFNWGNRITVRVLPPVPASEVAAAETHELMQTVRDRMCEALSEIRKQQ